MRLSLAPITLEQANAFVRHFHRHHKAPRRIAKFAVSVRGPDLCGVAIAGTPTARALDDGVTIEIYRVCTDGTRNACTMLYGASCRAAAALGYRLAITYTLRAEVGASLRAAGFRVAAEVSDRQWGRPTRPRSERDLIGDKLRWERSV